MGILYRGNTTFDDIKEPALSKNEWGTDVMVRVISGRKPLLGAFLASLVKGQVFQGFYLQDWQTDGGQVFPEVTMNYKGFLSPNAGSSGIAFVGGGPSPAPDGQNDTNTKTVTISGKITNAGVAQEIKGKPLEADETHDVYGIHEVLAFAPTTKWRYIVNAKPNGPKYSHVNTSEVPRIMRSRITAKWKDKEVVFAGANAPAALATALFMSPAEIVDSHSATNIIGSPYWECMDIICHSYLGDA